MGPFTRVRPNKGHTAQAEVHQRTQKRSCRLESRETLGRIPEMEKRGVEELTPSDAPPPWVCGTPAAVSRTNTSKDDPASRQLEKAEEAVAALGSPDLVAYTDGSATGGTRRGGAEIVVVEGERVLRRWVVPAGSRCSSYSAELTAMLEAAEWLRGKRRWTRPAVITDSRSLVDALEGSESHRRLDRLRQLLRECGEGERELTALWVPGHCGLQKTRWRMRRQKGGRRCPSRTYRSGRAWERDMRQQ